MVSHQIPNRPVNPDLPWGWIYEFECTDPDCYSGCKRTHQRRVQFGVCYPVEGRENESIMYDCTSSEFALWEPMFVMARWENRDCVPGGNPIEGVSTRGCYPKAFGFEMSECEDHWYKYQCYLGHSPWLRGEDGIAIDDGGVGEDPSVNVGIVTAILFFVCFIGVIAGNLIRRSRAKMRKSVEKTIQINPPCSKHLA